MCGCTQARPICTLCCGSGRQSHMIDRRQTSRQVQMALGCLMCVCAPVPAPRRYGCQKEVILSSSLRLIQKRHTCLNSHPSSNKMAPVPAQPRMNVGHTSVCVWKGVEQLQGGDWTKSTFPYKWPWSSHTYTGPVTAECVPWENQGAGK